MPMKTTGGIGLGVVAGDVLALRGTGLAAPETWALLCQAAQALQDLFLSNGGVVGSGTRAGPVVTPHTLELTARGRVTLLQAPPDTARAYLPPEYRPGRVYSDTDSEKMWMYSLGRALLDTTPRTTALTGTVSVSPSSALQSVLAAMTEPDPRRRASLMNLLDVISEYCRTRLQSRPFTHIVMDMHREVVRSAQYAARKRALAQSTRAGPQQQGAPPCQQQYQHPLGVNAVPQRQNPPPPPPQQQQQQQRHRAKGSLFRMQSRNSRSQPNLLSATSAQPQRCGPPRTSADGGDALGRLYDGDARPLHRHARTNSQPDCCTDRGAATTTTTAAVAAIPQVRSSSSNLPAMEAASDARNPNNPCYGDPIYAMPVKPFLSTQDVRNARHFPSYCGNAAALVVPQGSLAPGPRLDDAARAQAHHRPAKEDPYGTTPKAHGLPSLLQRQHSSPQFGPGPTRGHGEAGLWERARPAQDERLDAGAQQRQQSQPERKQPGCSEGVMPYAVPRGPPPPKPPRIITGLKKAAAAAQQQQQQQAATPGKELVRTMEKPQRDLKNGPRARRGRAVQRAPSRLYGTVNGLAARSFNKTHCVGPEFVVRANQPAKLLTVGDFKMNNIGRLTVIHLNGQRIDVTCDPLKVTAGELFQAIVQAESLEENFTLGLAALLAGDFAILPPDTKLNKVAPPGWINSGKSKGLMGLPTTFMLYLRLRFFLPSLRGIRNWISKHLLYLQIRRCILEQQLVCPLTQLISLTGLALQAEFGNYSINEHGCGDYFLLEHYVPESLILNSEEQQYRHPQLPDSGEALRKRLQQAHRERRGLDANAAEEMFITHAQSLNDYGAHYYIATTDTKELGKIVARQKKMAVQNQEQDNEQQHQQAIYIETENIYDIDKCSDYPIYGKIDFNNSDNREQNLQRSPYTDEQKIMLSKSSGGKADDIYDTPRKIAERNNNGNNPSSNNKSPSKSSKFKRSDSGVWLAVHSQGLKVFERGGRLRERVELAKFQWKDIQTLSYGKNCLLVYTRINGKRCKFKLKMDHRKSFYAFKLTSLHHQFYLKLRSELTSLQGLSKDFGVSLSVELNFLQTKTKSESGKTKISIADSVKKQEQQQAKIPTRLEEQQNKENENPLKDPEDQKSIKIKLADPPGTPEESNALYAQVTARLEPDGESRDTEDEADRALIINRKGLSEPNAKGLQVLEHTETDRLYNYANIGIPCGNESEEYVYTIPKPFSTADIDRLSEKIENPEDLYAAINKSGLPKKTEFTVPDNEDWKTEELEKALQLIKTANLPNCNTKIQNENENSPSGQHRLDAKMENRTMYNCIVQRDPSITDDLELMSLKSDTASIRSLSVKSNTSPTPEAYVLNADLRTTEETFRIPDETMSTSLMARLDEITFTEERMLRTIKLERGHGGSIGLQVTEGNDGGVYVQAVSVGGSADMAGNVNKGDRIVAINGQSLLNLGYEEALKMLQSTSKTVELVLSQIVTIHVGEDDMQEPIENNYLQNLRFNVSSETDNSGVMTTKWLQKTIDVASVQNTSSAYSSAASSAMGNHNVNSLYVPDLDETNGIHSANESSLPPAVPPRRKRGNVQPKRPLSPNFYTAKLERKNRPAPPLPQPAPPQRSKIGKKRSSSFIDKNLSSAKKDLHASYEYKKFSQNDSPENGVIVKDQCLNSEICEEVNAPIDHENSYGKSGIMRSFSPFSMPPEANKYPSLFFTYEDYQDVMEVSTEDLVKSVVKSSERVKANQTANISIHQKCKLVCDLEVSDEINDIFVPVAVLNKKETLAEDVEVIEQKTTSEILPFTETVTFNNEREEIYFRVTTTDRPFEKFLGDWDKSYDDGNVEKFEKEECADLYIFEDYMDRSNKLNKLNSRSQVLFSEEFFSLSEDNSMLTEKSTTRVRFLIESPSMSTLDSDHDDGCRVCEEFVEKQLENYEQSSLNLVEVIDKEIESFSDNMKIIDDTDSNLETLQNFESFTTGDENTLESFNLVTEAHNNESYSNWEEDVEELTTSVCIESEQKADSPLQVNVDTTDSVTNLNKNELLEKEISFESSKYEDNSVVSNERYQTCSRKVIFLDSSLYNLSSEHDAIQNCAEIILPVVSYDDDTINKKEESVAFETQEEKIFNSNSKTISENMRKEETVEGKSVPASTRRNVFLETMLSNNNLSPGLYNTESVHCKVIAIHPKQEQSASTEKQNTISPDVVAIVEGETKAAPRNSSRIKLTEPGSQPKSRSKINANVNNIKSAGEVKSDVLNELLTNFSAIKLRSVNPKTREPVLSGDSEDRNEKNASKSIKVKSDEIQEIKHVKNVVENKDVVNSSAILCSVLPVVETKTREIYTVDKDTCAIIKEAPSIRRNDNDNKAMSPVIINEDQRREAVSIIPGSVRNFVKYYEIHNEIANISKITDSVFKKQKSEFASKHKEARGARKSVKCSENGKKTSKIGAERNAQIRKDNELISGKSSKVSDYSTSPSRIANSFIQQPSCIKNKEPNLKSERNKSVQFDNECTYINPCNDKEKEEAEGTLSSFIGGIKTRIKGKAPVKPNAKKIEETKGLKLDQRRTESPAIINVQKPSELNMAAYTAKKGNRSFLPKTETLPSNQTIVFYCTV